MPNSPPRGPTGEGIEDVDEDLRRLGNPHPNSGIQSRVFGYPRQAYRTTNYVKEMSSLGAIA